MNRRILFSALVFPGLWISACMNSPEPAPAGSTWYGRVSNACGPADGPAVNIVWDSLPYADCQASHPGESRLDLNIPSLDSLKTGDVYRTAEVVDCIPACNSWFSTELKIETIESSRMRAAFTLKSFHDGPDTTVRTGTVILAKCPMRPLCG